MHPDRDRRHRPARAPGQRGRPVRVPHPDRPAAHQRARCDLGAGRERRGLRGRPRDSRAGPAQQGPAGLSQSHRLRPWRQWLRGRGVPARAVRRRRARRPGRPGARPRSGGHGAALRHRIPRRQAAQQGNRRTTAQHPLREPSGVQGQAGEYRSPRALRARATGRAGAVQRLPRVLSRAGAGAARRGRDPQRVLRERRCADRHVAAEAHLADTARG